MTILSSDHGRIILESSLYRRKQFKDFALKSWTQNCVAGAVLGEFEGWLYLLRALEMTFHMWRGSIMRFILRGRRSIWWGSRLTLLALRILNDVSYVTRINHEMHFAWQAQYLVKVEGDSCCSAHSKWRFICDADQSWDSFCVARAVIGEFEGWLYLLRALEMTFHMWRGSLMAFILRGRCSIWWRWIVIPVAPLIVNDVSYVTRINHHSLFAWQVQYFVTLEDDSCCSAHCKWRFICDGHQSWMPLCSTV